MKGLDWIAVASNIAFDDDLEHVSDAAFRTYIELLAVSAFRLSDGRVGQRDAQKLCNTRYLSRSLAELSNAGYVILESEDIVIPNYCKWQRTRAEVESERAKNTERGQRFRERGNGVTNGVHHTTRVEKSKSRVEKEEEEHAREPKQVSQNGACPWVAAYVDARVAAGEKPTKTDKATFGRKVKELGEIDPNIMADTISRMIELGKGPPLLPYVYGDCKNNAERELLQMAGGNRRVR